MLPGFGYVCKICGGDHFGNDGQCYGCGAFFSYVPKPGVTMPTRHPNKWHRSSHQQRVEVFMERAKQELPSIPTEPSEAIRLLRAKLIFEEALETIAALGIGIVVEELGGAFAIRPNQPLKLSFCIEAPFNMADVVDGCCDISVVTIGTLSALGVADMPLLELVDENNLAKFGPGHSIREDGKLVKPPGHKPPDIVAELVKQGWAHVKEDGSTGVGSAPPEIAQRKADPS